jgi:osmotically-inducible protein OsmY
MNVKTDKLIRDDVNAELSRDTRLKGTKIGVAVSKGKVTLTGTGAGYAQKLAAKDAAHRVDGVLDVVDDIPVASAADLKRTDMEIARDAHHALELDVIFPGEQIRPTVSDGWVTLEGEVETYNRREDIVSAVRNLDGVIGVHNWIVVERPIIKPEEIREVIEGALERRAVRSADQIEITVDVGEVTLNGTVQSDTEKRAVLGAVSHTRGVFSLRDHLTVQSHR